MKSPGIEFGLDRGLSGGEPLAEPIVAPLRRPLEVVIHPRLLMRPAAERVHGGIPYGKMLDFPIALNRAGGMINV